MDIDLLNWLNLAVRWLHVITGIAWIGSSFYFVWLDNHLRAPPRPKEGIRGEVWSVHGGGFYHNQKYQVAPEELPEELHWFKWEAYFTWISGFFLMVLIYYLGAELYLIDRAKLALTPWQAVALSLAALIGGWLVYDGLCRSRLGKSDLALGVVWFLLLTAAAYGLSLIFSDRAAYVQIGAMVGTVMAANVFRVIIPNQKKTVAAMLAGQEPAAYLGAEAKQRSLHNNYLTLPVLAMMIGSHYPLLYDHPQSWLIVALLLVGSGAFRHFLNRLDQGARFAQAAWLLPATAAALVVAVILTAHRPEPAEDVAETVSDEEAFEIVESRCSVCHAPEPVWEGYLAAPAGVKLHTPEQLGRLGHAIEVQAVLSRAMPPGNLTGITPEERAALGRWLADR